MPRYLIDLTFEVEADSETDAWLIANSAGLNIDEPDFQLEEVSPAWRVDTD